MTTTTATMTSQFDAHVGATLPRVIRSEWTKFWSVRSSMWTLLTTFLLVIGFAALVGWGVASSASHMSPEDRATFDATNLALSGLGFGQVAIGVLGVLLISSEYSTGGIRNTFTAVPRRLTVLAAKAVVLAVVSFIAGLIASFLAFFVANAFLSSVHLESHLGDPGVLRAVIGGGLYLLGSAFFGLSIGTLLRHSAGSITALVVLLLVAPPLTMLLPGKWGDTITKYFTSNAGQRILEVHHQPGQLFPWRGYAAFTVEWIVIFVIAAVLLQRRDA